MDEHVGVWKKPSFFKKKQARKFIVMAYFLSIKTFICEPSKQIIAK